VTTAIYTISSALWRRFFVFANCLIGIRSESPARPIFALSVDPPRLTGPITLSAKSAGFSAQLPSPGAAFIPPNGRDSTT
jgi:hypothetical protein